MARKSRLNLVIRNFKVIEDLGRILPIPKAIYKKVMVIVECLLCNSQYTGEFTHFKYGGRECLKCFPRSGKIQKDYTGESHGEFRIVRDLLIKKKGKQRKVIGQCIKCEKQFEHNYFSFKNLKIICECKYELERTEDWKRIRAIHMGMLWRCHNPKSKPYKFYGAKGIFVCDEWRYSRKSFYDWSIQNGYNKTLSIDRINNDLGYTPENCRWTTTIIQCRNKKNAMGIDKARLIKDLLSRRITHKEIARLTNVHHSAVSTISKGASWKDI